MTDLKQFTDAITATRQVWLLQAMEGMFAMLEDGSGRSYVPMWETAEKARQAASGDWEDYAVTEMGFSELYVWLRELRRDEIDIAVSPDKEGKITAIASADFRRFVKPYADESYREEKDEDDDFDDEADDDFDYGEGWAEKW